MRYHPLVLVIASTVVFFAGYRTGHHMTATVGCSVDALITKLEEIEARTTTLASTRCLVVNTERLDMDVYGLPNLGVHRVAKK